MYQKLRIGMVCYPTFGGSGIVATELGIALAKKGYEVHFITYSHPARLSFFTEGIYFHQVFVEEYPLFQYQPYELALSTKMAEVVLEHNLDLLHVHYAIPHAYAAFMCKQILKDKGKDIKVVTTLHGTDITLVGNHPSYKTAVEFSINYSDAVTCVSQSLQQETYSLFSIQKDISIIPNFIDFSYYPSENEQDCRKFKQTHQNDFIITHISNLRPVKRPADVIKTFYLINQKVPATLMLIGEGPEKEQLEYLVKNLGLVSKVHFLGNCQEIQKVLCLSDLFLLPSEKESFGLSALEAMAAKTPVISTLAGGLTEVNIHGVTGYTLEIGDVEGMANKAIELLQNPMALSEMKQNARLQAEKFSVDKIVPLYEAVYHQIMG